MRKIKSGKVRDLFELDDGNLVIVTTDRVSAFDVVLPDEIPYKGIVLNRLSEFWFRYLEGVIPNHMISISNEDMPAEFRTGEMEGRCMMVKKLDMLPIECIVRGYLSGSGLSSYKENNTICGIEFLPGLQEYEKLKEPIFTPTTKSTTGHDENMSFEQVSEIIGSDLALYVKGKSIEIYSKCAKLARRKGIIIADTKFEFGLDKRGNLVLADEVLTPDSSRFWPADKYRVGISPPSLDKQFLRDWLKSSGWNKKPPAPHIPKGIICETASRYFKIYQMLTNEIF